MSVLLAHSPLIPRASYKMNENMVSKTHHELIQEDFTQQYEEFKRLSKDIILQPRASQEFYDRNQFTLEEDAIESDLSDWVIINSSNEDTTIQQNHYKQGFLSCYFDKITNKRNTKYTNHWVVLEDHILTCYQSKVRDFNSYTKLW